MWDGIEVGNPGLSINVGLGFYEPRLEYSLLSIPVYFDQHTLDAIARRGANFEWFAGDWDWGHPLVGFEPVGMAASGWTVSDHSSSEIGAVTAPSASASVRNIACDHRSGVATGPHRSIHAWRAPGARR